MTPAAPRYLSAALSDTGPARGNNEDRVYTDDVRGIFAVIDGMGGHAAGEQAAAIAVERLKARLERQMGSPEQRVREAITLASNAIHDAAQSTPEWKGMACVLTVAVIEEGHATIGHVGDSRLYRLKRGEIVKITRDHSPVGEREDGGELTEDEAMKHPRRNEVYRDVGSEEHTPDDEDFIDVTHIPFEPDCALLLCSDGLSDVVRSAQILAAVQKHAGNRVKAVEALVALANANSKDNVSVVLVEGDTFAASFSKRPRKPARRPIQTDPVVEEEDTGRLPVVAPAAVQRVAWWGGLIYGAALAAVLIAGAWYFQQRWKPVLPRTLHVASTQGAYATISAALAVAAPGDTIEVAPGQYKETVRLVNNVALIARPLREATIVGGVTANGIHDARLEGFRIQGIELRDASVDVELSEVLDARRAGIEFSGVSHGSVSGCDIHDNAGAGIVISALSAPTIFGNLIQGNGRHAGDLQPGLELRPSGPAQVENNTFAANGAEAIWASAPADETLVTRNLFVFEGKPDNRRKLRVIPAGGAR